MEDYDNNLPSYTVHAFQIHQEQGEHGKDEEEIDIIYREKNFPVGSIVSFPIQSASPSLKPSDDEWNVQINPASFHIGKGAQLSIDTLALNPSSSQSGGGGDGNASLFISTDIDPDYSCLCPNLSFTNGNTLVTSLGLSVIGPATVHLALVNSYNSSYDDGYDGDRIGGNLQIVNVFGKVQAVSSEIQDIVSIAKDACLEVEGEQNYMQHIDIDGQILNEEQEIVIEGKEKITDEVSKDAKEVKITASAGKAAEKKKKRKLSNAEEALSKEVSDPNTVSAPAETPAEPQKLSKKQRRKLAKQKEKQLQDVVAKENGHGDETKTVGQTTSEKKISLTRPRMIKGGITVQDIVHGNGASVKMGRKVSINYIGTFPESGKVFDKNMGKSKPLTFRVGTGEVIKGLDRGLEGMKVNGERVIQIPSAMGYGSKGAGEIPPNSNLCFTVHLRSVGGR